MRLGTWGQLAKDVLDEGRGQLVSLNKNEDFYACLVRSCGESKNLTEGKRVHARIIESGYQRSRYVANLLLQMYSKCGSVDDACSVFEEIDKPNIFSWNIMITGYAQNGHLEEAKGVFDSMAERDVVSWTALIQAYVQNGHLGGAKVMFDGMPKRNVVTWTAMIQAYVHAGCLAGAKSTFDKMPGRNVVSWNTLVAACAQEGHLMEAQSMFDKMPEQDVVSWNAAVTAYAQNGQLHDAKLLFGRMPQRNVVSWNAMIAGSSRSGDAQEAKKVFDAIPHWDLASWNALITAYAQNGQLEDAATTFEKMPERNLITWTSMIALYAHNGHLDEAKSLFAGMPKQSVTSWNAMMAAYANSGHGKDAIELFRLMHLEGVKADEISFISVLTACTHEGLLDECWQYFHSMSADHCITPLRDHYCSVIDILGRAGQLRRAEELIDSMRFLPDAATWGALLGACNIHRDVVRARRAAEYVFEMDPENAAPYVLLTNVYTAAGRHEDVALLREAMRSRGLVKQPGTSFIRGQGRVHGFVVGDTSHPQNEEIRAKLCELNKLMKEAGYVPDTREVLHDVSEEEKVHLLNDHSEKLAIAFGLISTRGEDEPLRITKNLRVCRECHAAIKLISKLVRRHIIVRDANRFHHFEKGVCSCGDYW